MWEKFKRLPEDELLFTTILIVLVGIISFGLGRLSMESVAMSAPAGAIVALPESFIDNSDPATSVMNMTSESPKKSETGQFVASRSGSRYHLPECPSAQQIKEENKIYFATADAAEAAGYTKAANCPGL